MNLEEFLKKLEEATSIVKKAADADSNDVKIWAKIDNNPDEDIKKAQTYLSNSTKEAAEVAGLIASVPAAAKLALTGGLGAIAAIGGGVLLKSMIDYSSDYLDQQNLQNQIPESVQKIYDYINAYNEAVQSAKENIKKVDENAKNARQQWNEIRNMVDENGKLTNKANESEFKKAIGLMNNMVTDLNIRIIDNQIQNYDENETKKFVYDKIEEASQKEKEKYLRNSYLEASYIDNEVERLRNIAFSNLYNKSLIYETRSKRYNAYASYFNSNKKDNTSDYITIGNKKVLKDTISFDDYAKAEEELFEAEELMRQASFEYSALAGLDDSYKSVISEYEGQFLKEDDLNKYSKSTNDTAKSLSPEEYELKNLDTGKGNLNGNVFGMITDYTDIAKDVADIVPDWISTAATAVSDTINNYVEVPTPTYSIGSILNYDPSEDEDTIEDAEQTMKKLWDSVSMQENLGLISSEEAYRRRLDLIQEYCPEYSDEWYSYYKTILDYQRDALEEQVQDVQDGLSDIVSEYKAAYSKIESSVNSYKNKLLTVGDVFTITKEKDGEGNETKTYTVENLTEQMNKMRQYHKVIKELKERGVSDDVLRQLTTFDMDDGMVFAENLAKSSDAELEKINELYAERDKLAGDLANDLYAPEMDKLNSELIDSVVDRFGSLPEEIRAIGGESLAAFVEGILGDKDDLTAAAQEFIDSFFTACEEGISSAAIGMKNVGQNIADILGEQGSYSIRYGSGRKASDVSAEKMNSIYENAMAAHDHMANIMAASQQFNSYNYYENAPQASSRRDEKIVLDNKADITVKLDRETIGQTIYEWIKEYKWRTGT